MVVDIDASEATPSAPLQAELQADGVTVIRSESRVLANLRPFVFAKGWRLEYPVANPAGHQAADVAGAALWRGLALEPLRIELVVIPPSDTQPATYLARFTAGEAIYLESAGLSLDVRAEDFAGRQVALDGEALTLPAEPVRGRGQLASRDRVGRITLTDGEHEYLAIDPPAPLMVVLNDNREWNRPEFSVQLHIGGAKEWKAGEARELRFAAAFDRPALFTGITPPAAPAPVIPEAPETPAPDDDKEAAATPENAPAPTTRSAPAPKEADPPATGTAPAAEDKTFTPKEDAGWIPLQMENLEVAPGSALDFSRFPWQHAPAGQFGRVAAAPDGGRFVFADDAEKLPRRFYGVNVSGDALFLDANHPEELATRLAARGYNAVRMHNLDAPGPVDTHRLVDPAREDATSLDTTALDQLDRFFGAMKAHGLYVALDLVMNRQVKAKSLWPDAENPEELVDLRPLVYVNEAAFANWSAFARNLLEHRNPYTQAALGQDSALGWVGLVAADGLAGQLQAALRRPKVAADWRRAWNQWLAERLKTNPDALRDAGLAGDPAQGDVPFDLFPDAAPAGQTAEPTEEAAGREAARVDLIREFVAATEAKTFARMRDVVRASGCQALLTGAGDWLAGPFSPLQSAAYDYVGRQMDLEPGDPVALPRAYRNAEPSTTDLWDGLGQSWLQLTGKPFVISRFSHANPDRHRGFSALAIPAFAARQDVAGLWRHAYSHGQSGIGDDRAATSPLFAPSRPYNARDMATDPLLQHAERMALLLFLRGDLAPVGAAADDDDDAPATPARPSPAGDREKRTFWVDTPRSVAVYGPEKSVVELSETTWKLEGATALASIAATDGDAPIRDARRLLVTHLTDVLARDTTFGDASRAQLLSNGALPYLALDGTAEVSFKRDAEAPALRAWALDFNGNRHEEIPLTVNGDTVTLNLAVRGRDGANLAYELNAE